MGNPSPNEVRARLLGWYDANRRDLPWRRTRDPYRILVAEYLLQRTRIAGGPPYSERFLERLPTVRDLAAAPLDDVLAVWEGLGFYGGVGNLHAAAQSIVQRHGGEVPRSYDELASLPGIGPYTAGAVASIAFGIPVPAVDGNVVRVVARLFRIRENVTAGRVRRRIAEIAARLVSPERPGAFHQALMELPATVCTPLAPAWGSWPCERACRSRVDRTFSHRTWSGSIYRCSPVRRPKETDSVRWVPREEALSLPLVPFHRDAIKALAGLESFES